MVVTTTRHVQKRKGRSEGDDGRAGRCSKLTGTWLFSSDSSRTARVFLRIFLLPVSCVPSRPPFISLFLTLPLPFCHQIRRDPREKTEAREQRTVTCAGRWKKRSEIPSEGGGGRYVPTRDKTNGGGGGKGRRLCGEPAKGRNEPSQSVRRAERSASLSRISELIQAWKT